MISILPLFLSVLLLTCNVCHVQAYLSSFARPRHLCARGTQCLHTTTKKGTIVGSSGAFGSSFARPATRQFAPQTRLRATNKETIAIVGSGAVGCYYGARLWECGAYNVSFHMRGEHYSTSIEDGLNVTSLHGDIYIPPSKLQAFESTLDMAPSDWVVVCLKSSSLDVIPKLVAPLLHKDTRVLVIMNGLVEEDLLAAMTADAKERGHETVLEELKALYGGMALICSNRLGPGRVDHSYAGLLSGGCAVSRESTPDEDREAFLNLWEPTTVEVKYEESLLRGRWRKCVWNLPFNGISVAMGGITVDVIVEDPGLRRLAEAVMNETVAAANADLAAHGIPESQYLGEEDKEAMMDLSDNMGPYCTSTMLDLTQRKPMEVHYLFRKPVEKAQQLGVPVPHLETIVTQIEAMQRMYNLF